MLSDHVDKNHYRKFGFTMATAIALLFGLFFPVVFNKPFYLWPWIGALVFVVWAVALPRTLVVIYRPWMYISEILGSINSKIILGVVFFLMIAPISLMLKLIGKDPMNRKMNDRKQSSYWIESQYYPKTDMERCY